MKFITKLLLILVVILFPLLSVTSSIRLALTPFFIQWEYNRPDFPLDDYGFTTADRLRWAQYSIDYLLGKVSHSEFSAQVLPDGTPLFNPREIVHMLDVRLLADIVLKIWLGSCLFFLFILIIAMLGKWTHAFLKALRDGAQLTILLILAILMAVWLNFNLLFTKFHELFFEGDSWLFYYSDHLIRLFPLRFWQDLFMFIGACSLLACLIPILLYHRRKISD